MAVEPGVAVVNEEGKMVMVGDGTVRCDDTLGSEQPIIGSTTLTRLITNVEIIGIGSLPRRVDHRISTLVGCLDGCHMLPSSLCRGTVRQFVGDC